MSLARHNAATLYAGTLCLCSRANKTRVPHTYVFSYMLTLYTLGVQWVAGRFSCAQSNVLHLIMFVESSIHVNQNQLSFIVCLFIPANVSCYINYDTMHFTNSSTPIMATNQLMVENCMYMYMTHVCTVCTYFVVRHTWIACRAHPMPTI